MKQFLFRFWREERGVGALEFALVAPALILIIVGIAQLGTLYMSNAGLRNAVGEGARFATIFPRPTDAAIRTRIANSRFGLNPDNLTETEIDSGTADGAPYLDISVSYDVTLDFIFFTYGPVTLTENRRVFVQPTS